jgi:hypothetical protein
VEHVDPGVKDNAAPRICGHTSLIHNGGFEDGLNGWTLAAGAGSHGVDTGVRHGGDASLRITRSGAGGYGFWRDVPVVPGGRLLVRGFVRTQGMDGGAGLRIEWLDLGGAQVAERESFIGGGVSGTTDWVRRSAAPTVPVGSTRARVWAATEAASGTAWFDDVEAWSL